MRVVTLLAACLCVASLRAAEPAMPESAKDLAGCWVNEKNDKVFMRFEPARVRVLIDGQLQIHRAQYEPGRIVLRSSGPKQAAEYEIKDGILTLKGGEPQTFKKVDRSPEAMELRPLALGTAKPVSLPRVKALQEELAARQKEDQAVRTNPQRQGDMARVDGENTAWLKQQVQNLGWIDVERFGAEASNAAFLIVQHSGDLPLMLAALEPIEKDVKARRLDGQPYALLYDRVQLYTGNKQRFGTQVGRDKDGAPAVLPLEDPKRVEEFRKEVGLFPLAQYLAVFKQMNGGKPVKFLTDED